MINVLLLGSRLEQASTLKTMLVEAAVPMREMACEEDLIVALSRHAASVVVMDMHRPEWHDGLALLAQCHAIDAQLPVIVLSARGDAAAAIEAMRKGAHEFVTDAQLAQLPRLVQQAQRARDLVLRGRNEASAEVSTDAGVTASVDPIQQVMRGRHPAITKLRQTLLRLARVDTDVLVRAETGCGKEVVARCLHDYGPRASKPFVAINCGAIPENIFESELFGHEAGAFTGAAKRRVGKLEFAAGGTVFLDEIESLPWAMQVKLLRALQQRTIERVGGNEPVRLTCRIIAATKDDLLALAQQNRFRMDLYYRLNVVELGLPPLRERRDDIPMLAQAFADEAATRHGLPPAPLDIEFIGRLMAREWPGNVRELRNAVERQMLGLPETTGDDGELPHSLAEQVAAFERALIEQSLRLCLGSVSRVSEVLNVPRKTLYDKLTKFSVDPSQFRADRANQGSSTVSYAPLH
jgi:DNA-binding NtrC family response regulator